MDCPDNSVYSPAIVGCPRTCADPEAETQCEAIPQEGCQCKEGYVLSGEKCVIEDECGCFYNDQYYPVWPLMLHLLCLRGSFNAYPCIYCNLQSTTKLLKISINNYPFSIDYSLIPWVH